MLSYSSPPRSRSQGEEAAKDRGVEPDEVLKLVVSDARVTVRTGDERELRLLVLDHEGFAEVIMEMRGFRVKR